MLDDALMTLVRATLLAELGDVEIRQAYQPSTIGVPSLPTVFMQTIIPARRVGWVGRRDIVAEVDGPMRHDEIQWLETTIQISALVHRDPAAPPPHRTAIDLCREAADILQGDRGLAQMGAQRVRPLRISEVRVNYFVNDQDQFEANPSFDVVLSHVQIRAGETAPVSEFVSRAGRV